MPRRRLLAIFARESAQASGVLAWAAMAFAFQPILRFYRLSPLWGLALPLIGFDLCDLHARFGDPALARARRHVEGPRTGDGTDMRQRA